MINRLNIPSVTKNLLIINLVFYVATMINSSFMIETFAAFYPGSPFFKIWQPITHMFMHGGFFHLFLNMYSLLMFGSAVEQSIGSRKFFVFYFICGISAISMNWVSQSIFFNESLFYIPTLGASGAVFGILAGFAMLYPQATLMLIFPPIPVKAKWLAIIFAVLELVAGLSFKKTDIAHFAHLGGMLFGWLLILYWKKSGKLYDWSKWI